MTTSVNVNPDPNAQAQWANTDGVEIRVLLARFETKLDLVLGQHEITIKDHEARLRVVEDRKTVSPMAMLATSATAVALLGGILTFLDRLYK